MKCRWQHVTGSKGLSGKEWVTVFAVGLHTNGYICEDLLRDVPRQGRVKDDLRWSRPILPLPDTLPHTLLFCWVHCRQLCSNCPTMCGGITLHNSIIEWDYCCTSCKDIAEMGRHNQSRPLIRPTSRHYHVCTVHVERVVSFPIPTAQAAYFHSYTHFFSASKWIKWRVIALSHYLWSPHRSPTLTQHL